VLEEAVVWLPERRSKEETLEEETMVRYRGVWVLLIATMLLAGACGRLTGAAEPRQGGEGDQGASAEGAASQAPDGLKQFSREALLALPYCANIARGERTEAEGTDVKLEVQGDLSSAIARFSLALPLPELLPNWVHCHYTYLYYNDESHWSIILKFGGPPSEGGHYFFASNAARPDGTRFAEEAADEPVSGRPGWYWRGGSLGPPPDVPTEPMVVAWWSGNDYFRVLVTGYDLDDVLAIADSVH
jgi:hypothetical protein